jgi:hypothetical protein
MNVNERSNELSKRSGTKLFQNVRKRSQKSNVNYQNKTNTRKILKKEHYFAFYMTPLRSFVEPFYSLSTYLQKK